MFDLSMLQGLFGAGTSPFTPSVGGPAFGGFEGFPAVDPMTAGAMPNLTAPGTAVTTPANLMPTVAGGQASSFPSMPTVDLTQTMSNQEKMAQIGQAGLLAGMPFNRQQQRQAPPSAGLARMNPMSPYAAMNLGQLIRR